VLYEGRLPPSKVFASRIGKAFTIIIGAAATTVIAMTPLVVMGFGTLRRFAHYPLLLGSSLVWLLQGLFTA